MKTLIRSKISPGKFLVVIIVALELLPAFPEVAHAFSLVQGAGSVAVGRGVFGRGRRRRRVVIGGNLSVPGIPTPRAPNPTQERTCARPPCQFDPPGTQAARPGVQADAGTTATAAVAAHASCQAVLYKNVRTLPTDHVCYGALRAFRRIKTDVERLAVPQSAATGLMIYSGGDYISIGLAATLTGVLLHNCEVGKIKLTEYEACLTRAEAQSHANNEARVNQQTREVEAREARQRQISEQCKTEEERLIREFVDDPEGLEVALEDLRKTCQENLGGYRVQ